MQLSVKSNRVMDAGDHFKNGASPKSLMSRGNIFNFLIIMKKVILSVAILSIIAVSGGISHVNAQGG